MQGMQVDDETVVRDVDDYWHRLCGGKALLPYLANACWATAGGPTIVLYVYDEVDVLQRPISHPVAICDDDYSLAEEAQ